jgi:MoaD family protein
MSVKVMIPTALRHYADGHDTVELEADRVGDVLRGLATQFPDLKKHLFAADGQLRNFVNVFVNDDNIRDRQGADTAVADGDEVMIIPAIAGGTEGIDEPRSKGFPS